MLEEYLREAKTSSEYAARWWACIVDNPCFEQGVRPEYNVPWPPIDEPSKEALVRFGDELTLLIDDELNKTWGKQSSVYDESGEHHFVPTPMHVLLWSHKNTPCEIMQEASNNSETFIPWWCWQINIQMRVSRFHVELQRNSISPWQTLWGTIPESIPPAMVKNSIQHVRGMFDSSQ